MPSNSSALSILLKNPRATASALIALGSLVSISMAWGFEIIGGYVPCKLCLAQRVPYYWGLPIGIFAFVFALRPKLAWLSGVLLLIGTGLFLYGGGVGVYQAGAEWDFWLGPNDCGGPMKSLGNATDLLSSLESTRVVSCSNAPLRILGLSFAGMNVLYSLGMSFVAVCGIVLGTSPLLSRKS
ncbi:disulfide bond formation protein B [Rhodobacteraceae bacterium RKSG542]|uniref:disulfide bond formation protein B n=1 Tax=Pseudovibrio flavus TaxID=2529854 RepID=UPI0012BBCBD0|nr:disulfide bond formation protein B [Pseudovibrio flavus]MTI18288.1 disulfide bond formation protein B [Pseudovibrio flavus]